MQNSKFRVWNEEENEMLYFTLLDIPISLLNLEPDSELVLQQYTGLNDKNSKEIYTGDFVKHPVLGVFEVNLSKGIFRMGIYILLFNHKEVEVISNIYSK